MRGCSVSIKLAFVVELVDDEKSNIPPSPNSLSKWSTKFWQIFIGQKMNGKKLQLNGIAKEK